LFFDKLLKSSRSTVGFLLDSSRNRWGSDKYWSTSTKTKLKLSNEWPSMSLWSVLKYNIGKVLMRISFPVFFNEPTSMLQQMVSVLLGFWMWIGADGHHSLGGGYGVL
jgi:hypothetical protein